MMVVINNYGEFLEVFTWRTDSLTTKWKTKINIRTERIKKEKEQDKITQHTSLT
jgi:hypothetical protein